MNTLIINAADDKILFSLITDLESYTTTHINSRENFDKIMILISNFLNEHDSNLDKISEIFVNQGPGKISSIRNSIAIAKGIAFAKNSGAYTYNGNTVQTDNTMNVASSTTKYTQLTIGGQPSKTHLKRIIYYSNRISDTQLRNLTS